MAVYVTLEYPSSRTKFFVDQRKTMNTTIKILILILTWYDTNIQ